MGWGLWRSPAVMSDVAESAPRPAGQTFARAMATCLLNPKAYLFMVAVFPQFVRPQAGPVVPQILAMAAIIAATQAVVYGAVAMGAVGVRASLRGSAAAQAAVGRGVALLLMGTALWALWEGLR
jgi:threonine/homoserine/homoserine lactone efflux protein